MRFWQRSGISLMLLCAALLWTFRSAILLFPFLILTSLYIVLLYLIPIHKVHLQWAIPLTAFAAISTGYFVLSSGNSPHFWGTDALAILAGCAVVLAFTRGKHIARRTGAEAL